jgi:uncharacterized protein DUF6378
VREPRVFKDGDPEPADYPDVVTANGYTLKRTPRESALPWERFDSNGLSFGCGSWNSYTMLFGPLTEILPAEPANSFDDLVTEDLKAVYAAEQAGRCLDDGHGGTEAAADELRARREAEPEPPRVSVLNEAAGLITGDRNKAYGTPTQNFTNTAQIWTALLRHKLRDGEEILADEVAALMVGLKLARTVGQPKRDNWVDMAGYAGCGYEAAVENGRIEGGS